MTDKDAKLGYKGIVFACTLYFLLAWWVRSVSTTTLMPWDTAFVWAGEVWMWSVFLCCLGWYGFLKAVKYYHARKAAKKG
jgi:hypothetical protein